MNRNNKSIVRIRDALITLLSQKPFADIQVKDIVTQADIARATFYLHYSSKEEVLLDYIDTMFSAFFERIELALEHADALDESVALKMFQTFAEEPEFCRVLLQDSLQPLLLKRFRGYLSRIVGHVSLNNQQFAVPNRQLSYLVDYWAGGSLLLISRWVSEDFQPPAEDMANLYAKLTLSGMKALLA